MLCKDCWETVEELKNNKKKEEVFVRKMRSQAKEYLLEIMHDLCKHCEHMQKGLSDECCLKCSLSEKEKLIRAFLE